MAATTDRARFYLEQYVPELQEWSQKGIFSRDEITSITKKRSDFEHILNARGSTPADYARYATYEMNLDALRKKRCKRLGVKASAFGGQSSQRTVFFVLDRATKKFPGDMGLWMQYINFCKKEKAGKTARKMERCHVHGPPTFRLPPSALRPSHRSGRSASLSQHHRLVRRFCSALGIHRSFSYLATPRSYRQR